MPRRVPSTATKWTLEAILDDARSYPTYKAWYQSSKSAHVIAHRKGWLPQVHEAMRTVEFMSTPSGDVHYMDLVPALPAKS